MASFYVTTPIYYVNDVPHIGHIYTTLIADTIARYRRRSGKDVYFLTGTDEHGQKIERAAEERGIQPIELADEVVARYHTLWKHLDITHDDFIRTTQERHAVGVREIVRRIAAKGDFYVDRHQGWYCTGCETFYTEKELDGENCPIHGRPAERRDEENIFFRLSKYQDALLEWYATGAVQPATRLNEVKSFVEGGLRDLSVSRAGLDWGIPFPDHDGQAIYVWLDALTNYISALGFGHEDTNLYDTFWQGDGERLHLVGKDILRFHAVYWPAFLMSADLPLPTTVWAHGWWLRDDQKMSKSVGNVVRPDGLIEAFGVDSLRFFLLRDMVFGQDASFSDEAFIDRYNSDLANDLGNTVSRLVSLSRRAFDDRLPPKTGNALQASAESAVAEYHRLMESYAFSRALEVLWKLLGEVSQYLVANEPWKKLKDPEALDGVSEVLWCGLETTRIVATALLPVLPETAPRILATLGAEVTDGWDGLAWGGLPTGSPLAAVDPTFPRIDKKAYLGDAEPKSAKAGKVSGGKKGDSKKGEAKKSKAKGGVDADGRIGIDQFFESELRIATIDAAERVPKSDKLLKLTVDVGEDAPRTIVAGLGKAYEPEALVGLQVVVVANLKPAKLMGVESNGMVLAATADGHPVLLQPAASVPNGTRAK